MRANTVAFGFVSPSAGSLTLAHPFLSHSHILTRLTQAKELGETIEVNGKSASVLPLFLDTS